MCFDLDSEPPVPVIAGASVSHRDLTLVSADGTPFAAFLAEPDEANGIGIVILPDIRGLYHFYEELALRFAERGYTAIVFDFFGRLAGASKRDDDFPYKDLYPKIRAEHVQDDLAASAAVIRGIEGATDKGLFTVGFCFGGRHSWLAAAGGHGIDGAIGFYGFPTERFDEQGPTELAGTLAAPILALQAGVDERITPEINAAFEQAMTAAGVTHELIVYDGAPHSFFDRRQEDFAEASEDAWQRVLAFIAQYAR